MAERDVLEIAWDAAHALGDLATELVEAGESRSRIYLDGIAAEVCDALAEFSALKTADERVIAERDRLRAALKQIVELYDYPAPSWSDIACLMQKVAGAALEGGG